MDDETGNEGVVAQMMRRKATELVVIDVELQITLQYGVGEVNRVIAAFCASLFAYLSPLIEQIELGDDEAAAEHDDASGQEAEHGDDDRLQVSAEPRQAGRHDRRLTREI